MLLNDRLLEKVEHHPANAEKEMYHHIVAIRWIPTTGHTMCLFGQAQYNHRTFLYHRYHEMTATGTVTTTTARLHVVSRASKIGRLRLVVSAYVLLALTRTACAQASIAARAETESQATHLSHSPQVSPLLRLDMDEQASLMQFLLDRIRCILRLRPQWLAQMHVIGMRHRHVMIYEVNTHAMSVPEPANETLTDTETVVMSIEWRGREILLAEMYLPETCNAQIYVETFHLETDHVRISRLRSSSVPIYHRETNLQGTCQEETICLGICLEIATNAANVPASGAMSMATTTAITVVIATVKESAIVAEAIAAVTEKTRSIVPRSLFLQ